MAIQLDPSDETPRTITLPPGPALLYVTEGDNPTITILDRADLGLMPYRDRGICRALLVYVIEGMEPDKL